ncbi:aminoglycoside phosphotransferase family protein [Streptomyces sp. NRRL S-646]|uniref:aminoglycoside phosphotransferase family protein n=1 Tax=Streptomyces sp. NRRL S-646 TaxID=1463917 RepID=UPI000AF3C969|nr:aminoglycoside phosphotransferase family protein [Streptomyces sp. NRRL S-646]
MLTGHHNTNYVLRVGLLLALLLGIAPFVRFKYRVPLKTVEVVPRIWPSEVDVLEVVCRHLSEVPRGLAVPGDRSLHRYLRGKALSERNPDGRIDDELMREFAAFFVRTAQVPAKELPACPVDWPADGESEKFLHWLVDFTENRVHLPNRDRFGDLFDAVGIPLDAMTTFKKNHRELARRPFVLLHTDVHRANVVLHRKGIAVIDWELAIYGDPLHDLATHVVRMGYSEDEKQRMIALWAEAMEEAGLGSLTAGLHDDLSTYLDFEYAQSVFPDIMRAALALPADAGELHFRGAGDRVSRAMQRARKPLELDQVPDSEQIVEALRKWHSMHATPAPIAKP